MANLIELRELKRKNEEERKKLEKEIAEAEAKALADAQYKVEQKIESMTNEEKERILSSMKHECNSCIEGFTENGYSYHRGYWKCRKCMMMEILDGRHGGEFDFEFTVEIHKVTV